MVRLSKKVLLALAVAMAALYTDAAVHTVSQVSQGSGQSLNVNSAGSINDVNVGITFGGGQTSAVTNTAGGVGAGAGSAFGVGVNNGGLGMAASQALGSVRSADSLASSNQASFRGGSVVDGALTMAATSYGTVNANNQGLGSNDQQVNGFGLGAGLTSIDHGLVSSTAGGLGSTYIGSTQATSSSSGYVIPTSNIQTGLKGNTIGYTQVQSGTDYTTGTLATNGNAAYGGSPAFGSTITSNQYASQAGQGSTRGYGVANGVGLNVGGSPTYVSPSTSSVIFTSNGQTSSNNFGSASAQIQP